MIKVTNLRVILFLVTTSYTRTQCSAREVCFSTFVTLFGKRRLNENSVEAFFRCNAFSTHCKCVEEHFQCVLKHCQCISTEVKCVANPFKKHFQNIVNALANIDNVFNEIAAGCLESFTEPLLLDSMKSLL